MMCGKRWYPERKVVMSRIGDCSNCGRETSIVGGGLCGICYTATHNKFEKGTTEYNSALQKAKERCTGLEAIPIKPPKEWKRAGHKDSNKTTLEALEEKRSNLTNQLIRINQAIEVIETL